MNIYIENETGIRFNFRGYKKLIENVIETTAKEKNIPGGLEVNVMLVSPERIRQINKETRNIDKVTDVLSFPYFEFEEPGVFEYKVNNIASDNNEDLDVETDKDLNDPAGHTDDYSDEPEMMLGDIIICAGKVIEQAEAFCHSQKRELAFLVVHSMLHLIGYDHMNDEDEKRMTKEAEKLMNILGITREI